MLLRLQLCLHLALGEVERIVAERVLFLLDHGGRDVVHVVVHGVGTSHQLLNKHRIVGIGNVGGHVGLADVSRLVARWKRHSSGLNIRSRRVDIGEALVWREERKIILWAVQHVAERALWHC